MGNEKDRTYRRAIIGFVFVLLAASTAYGQFVSIPRARRADSLRVIDQAPGKPDIYKPGTSFLRSDARDTFLTLKGDTVFAYFIGRLQGRADTASRADSLRYGNEYLLGDDFLKNSSDTFFILSGQQTSGIPAPGSYVLDLCYVGNDASPDGFWYSLISRAEGVGNGVGGMLYGTTFGVRCSSGVGTGIWATGERYSGHFEKNLYADTVHTAQLLVGNRDTVSTAAVLIDTLGGVRLRNRARAWDEVSTTAVGWGSDAPIPLSYGGSNTKVLGYPGDVPTTGHWTLQLPRRYASGDSCHISYHICRGTGNMGALDSIIFVSKYFWQNIDSTQGEEYIDTIRIGVPGIEGWQHKVFSTPARNFANKQVSSVLIGSITRLTNHPRDTFEGPAVVLSVRARFKVFGLGTRGGE